MECSGFYLWSVLVSIYGVFRFLFMECSGFYLWSVPVSIHGVFRFLFMECSGFYLWSVPVSIYGVLRFLFMECSGFHLWSVWTPSRSRRLSSVGISPFPITRVLVAEPTQQGKIFAPYGLGGGGGGSHLFKMVSWGRYMGTHMPLPRSYFLKATIIALYTCT